MTSQCHSLTINLFFNLLSAFPTILYYLFRIFHIILSFRTNGYHMGIICYMKVFHRYDIDDYQIYSILSNALQELFNP